MQVGHRTADEAGFEDGWITAYADLISAILAVIIVLFKQYEARVEAYVQVQEPERVHAEPELVQNPVASVRFEADPLDRLQIQITRIARQLGLTEHIVLERDRYGLEMSLDSVALFAVDSAQLNVAGIAQLDPIFRLIAEQASNHRVDLSGHTDDTGRAERNWELSSQRAVALLNYLESRNWINPQRVRLIALADTRPRIDPRGLQGAELAQARAANRRISLRVHRLLDGGE